MRFQLANVWLTSLRSHLSRRLSAVAFARGPRRSVRATAGRPSEVASITLDHQQRATFAVLVRLPSNRPGTRAIRSKLPALLLEHAQQRNAFHLDAHQESWVS